VLRHQYGINGVPCGIRSDVERVEDLHKNKKKMFRVWLFVLGLVLVQSLEQKKCTCLSVVGVNSSDWVAFTPSNNPTWKPVTDDPTPPPTISPSTIGYEIPIGDGNQFTSLPFINYTGDVVFHNNTIASESKPVPLLRTFGIKDGGKKEKGDGKKGKKVCEDG
jgi:hypothetical protein